ncbi:alpha/beta fold hydrolase [Streptomyces sp. NPDC002073]|uniref:alpha/beta fold hydrolase n=1 Tax=Streptomyces sp. NBC_00239 TaxID=2903640 RepID=UPI002E2B9FEB|nr:alpha/beta hydrolase [Streptomyces sp. NBC_00239]
MTVFTSYDGTKLGYSVFGDGSPVICLPGGPMQDSRYLGQLGGLTAHRQLIMLDPRGTGRSEVPADTASYRCDRLVDDVEALRTHLGLDRIDVLAHSAGTNLAVLYAARHPERVGRLALITPSAAAAGIAVTGEGRQATARLRRDEPWFPAAYAALEELVAGRGGADSAAAIAPFFHGRWDEAAQRFQAANDERRNNEAAAACGAEGAYDPAATRAALGRFASPVLVVGGEFDVNSPPSSTAEFAGLFPHAEHVVLQGAGHFPWRDDAEGFVAATAAFLA